MFVLYLLVQNMMFLLFHFRIEDLYSFKLKFTRQLTVLALKINLGTGNVSEKPSLLRKCELEASESVTQHFNNQPTTHCLKTFHEEEAAAPP